MGFVKLADTLSKAMDKYPFVVFIIGLTCFVVIVSKIYWLHTLPLGKKEETENKERIIVMNKPQIKSKERVAERGEVFTNEREVKAMCDLVAHECERIESRFLEPACGDGNFLAEVVKRKLASVKKLYGKNRFDYERYSVLAMSSIYGIDIMADNVRDCRARLFEQWDRGYQSVCKKDCNNDTRNAVIYILERNILCGNALTLMCVDEDQKDIPQNPIIFAEWSPVSSGFMSSSWGGLLKRRDFRLDVLLKANEKPKEDQIMPDLEEDIRKYLSINPVTGEYMAEPIRDDYRPVHYKKLSEQEEKP